MACARHAQAKEVITLRKTYPPLITSVNYVPWCVMPGDGAKKIPPTHPQT